MRVNEHVGRCPRSCPTGVAASTPSGAPSTSPSGPPLRSPMSSRTSRRQSRPAGRRRRYRHECGGVHHRGARPGRGQRPRTLVGDQRGLVDEQLPAPRGHARRGLVGPDRPQGHAQPPGPGPRRAAPPGRGPAAHPQRHHRCENRAVTTLLAQHVRGQSLFDGSLPLGIQFTSKTGYGTCWARWDRRADDGLTPGENDPRRSRTSTSTAAPSAPSPPTGSSRCSPGSPTTEAPSRANCVRRPRASTGSPHATTLERRYPNSRRRAWMAPGP